MRGTPNWRIRFVLALALFAISGTSVQPALATQNRGSGDPYFQANSFDQEPTLRRPESPKQVTASLPDRSQRVSTTNSPVAGTRFEPSEVVAIVGNEPILVGDMLLEVNQIISQQLSGYPPEIVERERRNIISVLADRFVTAKMLYQDGISGLPDGVDVKSILKQAEDDFDENMLPKLMERSKIDSPAAFDAHLRALGSSLRQFRTTWAKEQLSNHLLKDKLKVNQDVSHAEMLEYYRSHIDEFRHEARAKWEELMVLKSRFSNPTESRNAIGEMGNKVYYGASLAEVARKSSDGLTAKQGGQYDWTTQGSLVSKELDQQIFQLPVDYLSDVIESGAGLHIIRVVEREDAHTTSFRNAQPEIRKKLLEARSEEARQKYQVELRRKIPYEIVFEK